MLRPLGVHHADGRHEVGQDHDGEEDEDVVVEVGGQEGQHEASGDDVEGREEEPASSLAAEMYIVQFIFVVCAVHCSVQCSRVQIILYLSTQPNLIQAPSC